jgi:hypothetical protein
MLPMAGPAIQQDHTLDVDGDVTVLGGLGAAGARRSVVSLCRLSAA